MCSLAVAIAAPLPPLVCPAGGALGAVDLRVASSRDAADALPLRTINRLEEGEILQYRPVLRTGEVRRGEVTFVLLPANKTAAGEELMVLEPKAAAKPQQWEVPWRVGVIVFVYGPSGLNTKKVHSFLKRDDEVVAQLADYAEKTAQTEALLTALSSPNTSSESVEAAMKGFASQYGLTPLDRTAPTGQQAMIMFRTLNPVIAASDPISPQGNTQGLQEAASLATTVGALFFGSPVGLAAGGTAMVMELRAIAFPRAEFRSSFSQSMPNDVMGLCGRRDPAPAHTHVAYLWASRIPNSGPPALSIDKPSTLPLTVKSPLPLTVNDTDWKFVDRARNWTLQQEGAKPVPIKVSKLGDTKSLELDLNASLKPGKYTLAANWDWDHFQVKGVVDVKALNDLKSAQVVASSQDSLVAKTGKVPVALAGTDFEFVTKVEIEHMNDKFATASAVPFVLPRGLRQGDQQRMDIQVNTIDLDPGDYRLLLTQVDGKSHPVNLKILPAPPAVANLPVLLNEGASDVEFLLKGRRLDLLQRVEVAGATVELGPPRDDERTIKLHMIQANAAGTSLAAKAYIEDRSEPLTFADAVRIVGPRPSIVSAKVSQPPDVDVQLQPGELAGGVYLSAMMQVKHLQSNSVVKLDCGHNTGGTVVIRLGQRTGPLSLQQLAPDQIFVSFDSSVWYNGCRLTAVIANGKEGDSEPFQLGRIVRVPSIETLQTSAGDAATEPSLTTLTGQNLETIEKLGWSVEQPETVQSLPLPIDGSGQKQRLQIQLGPRPDPAAPIYVWLRGESSPRLTKLKS